MRSNHIGVGVNNDQAQTNDKLNDASDMTSKEQVIEEESSHTHSGKENEILQECSSVASISLETELLRTKNALVSNSF